ncbi:MAG: type II secretion system F family protein [Planctomycetes bacterium]|nr:type II secretion system F family protein [Planctomycetota bacterium]MCB9910625.1 type II secretion system F family protein [Planctomycetota bacterium]HPF13486.1 type II secretion system F family protein [Planctomycetota bacterium]HRV80682.1 type II secretion system F family protein [Planctomycetota bacterium]
MSQFKYSAKEPSGNTVSGTIEASTKADALQALRRQNLVIMRLDESGGGGGKKKAAGGGFSFGGTKIRAKKGELVIFTRQLATMVGAGLSMLESLEVLGVQAESAGMKLCCEKLVSDVRGGSDLSQAMHNCPKVFNHLYISMVKAGEVSGQMDIILNRLADYEEASQELSREIRSAMTYPVISMVLVLGITAFLMIGVVPSFKNIFESMDIELPAITKFVLAVSDFMRANALGIGGAMFAAIMAIGWWKKTNTGERVWDWLMLQLPVFGNLFRKVALARFSRTFSTLIRSGVPMLGVLDIVCNTSGNRIISDAVRKSKDSVRDGNLLSEPLENEKVFPPMVVRMIAIGERTGALETLLEKIAEFYDSQVKAQVKALTSLIEPLLISVMGVIVGGVVLSIFAPILNMVSNLSGQK